MAGAGTSPSDRSDSRQSAAPPADSADSLTADNRYDDVLARRARLKRVASLGQRTGYGLYLSSLALGVVGIQWGYTPLLSTLIAVALVVGSMLLAPTIIMSHGIKAAEREERQERQAQQAPQERSAQRARDEHL